MYTGPYILCWPIILTVILDAIISTNPVFRSKWLLLYIHTSRFQAFSATEHMTYWWPGFDQWPSDWQHNLLPTEQTAVVVCCFETAYFEGQTWQGHFFYIQCYFAFILGTFGRKCTYWKQIPYLFFIKNWEDGLSNECSMSVVSEITTHNNFTYQQNQQWHNSDVFIVVSGLQGTLCIFGKSYFHLNKAIFAKIKGINSKTNKKQTEILKKNCTCWSFTFSKTF